ncbi:beta-ketoacyl synthase N-terminal-like domain-containing protein [Streptomyces sp. NPDC005917]|uniref:beta-ketoacyl synthase N-terminal-like domain-containing protein n=1 Tax=unclassified Streptomyces TaxID=2593676 RepID=UPI0033DF0766
MSTLTAPVTTVAPLLITGTGVLSSAGQGLGTLQPSLPSGDAPRADLSQISDDLPPIALHAVADLNAEEYLGGKGIRHLDRTTKLALVACARALAGLPVPLADDDKPRTGVVIGTSTGSIRSSSEFSRDTLVQDKPYLVRANLFPNSVMNCCAGQIAIRSKLRGVNATIAGGRLSSLNAIRYARNAIAGGHVDRALVGAVEELCPQSAWGWHLSKALSSGAAVGEGCAVFMVERPEDAATAGRPALAQVLACEVSSAGTGVHQGSLAAALSQCIERALRRSEVSADQVSSVSLGCSGHVGLERIEERGVAGALGALPARTLRITQRLGETFSASGSLQLAALLAAWQEGPGDGEVALVTSVGTDGNVGCLVVRSPSARLSG